MSLALFAAFSEATVQLPTPGGIYRGGTFLNGERDSAGLVWACARTWNVCVHAGSRRSNSTHANYKSHGDSIVRTLTPTHTNSR